MYLNSLRHSALAQNVIYAWVTEKNKNMIELDSL